MNDTIPDTLYLPLYRESVPIPNRIARNDPRYRLLQTIPEKEYEPLDDLTYVYLRINDNKDYYITVDIRYEEEHPNDAVFQDSDDDDDDDDYSKLPSVDSTDDEYELPSIVEIQIQAFRYEGNRIIWVSGNRVTIR